MNILRTIAIVGNALYILWMVYNGIDVGFSNILSVEGVSIMGLIVLLILDITLLVRKNRK